MRCEYKYIQIVTYLPMSIIAMGSILNTKKLKMLVTQDHHEFKIHCQSYLEYLLKKIKQCLKEYLQRKCICNLFNFS